MATEQPLSIKPLTANRLLTGFVWVLGGNLFYAACQWLMLAAIARLGNPAFVGVFSLAIALTAPVFMLTNLQLRSVYITEDEIAYPLGLYITTRFLLSMGAYLLIVVGVLLYADDQQPGMQTVLWTVGLSKLFETGSDLIYGYYQKTNRQDRQAWSLVWRGGGGCGLFVLVWQLTGRFELALIAFSSFTGLCLLVDSWCFVRLFQQLNQRQWPKLLWSARSGSLIRLALPLGLVAFVTSLSSSLPRYTIDTVLGVGAVGIFSAVTYVKVATVYVIDAMSNALMPELSHLYAANQPAAFRLMMNRFLVYSAGIGLCYVTAAWLGGRFFLETFYTDEYAPYTNLLILTMLSAGINYIGRTLSYGMMALRQYRQQLVLGLTESIAINLILWLLIPVWGLSGAGLALVLGELIRVIVSGFYYHKSFQTFQRLAIP